MDLNVPTFLQFINEDFENNNMPKMTDEDFQTFSSMEGDIRSLVSQLKNKIGNVLPTNEITADKTKYIKSNKLCNILDRLSQELDQEKKAREQRKAAQQQPKQPDEL